MQSIRLLEHQQTIGSNKFFKAADDFHSIVVNSIRQEQADFILQEELNAYWQADKLPYNYRHESAN